MAIAYTEKGKGPVVLLVHGFCENKHIWKHFQHLLSEECRVIAIDLPGFGETPLNKGKTSIEDVGEAVYDFIRLLKLESVIYIGHSLGGYVGLALAEKHPEVFKGLCLFHSSAYADTEERKSGRDKTIAFIEKFGVQVFADSFVEPLFYVKNRAALQHEIQEVIGIAGGSSYEGVVETTKAMRDRADRTDVLKTFPHPILFIAGKQDQTIPIEKIMEQVVLPQKSLIQILDEAGHMGMIEKEEETIKMVKNFIVYCS
ncbi:MAG: alpha/beta hydrolase [Cytophagaceae bacterium]|jgi:pimeloyl-ACP methyl ester carboxylesterase|nr:alpha/beta hydrolase [Cytophagaceae bacterium]